MSGLTAVDPAFQWVARLALALLFAAAALHKLRDRRGFESAVAGYGLLPAHGIRAFAVGLPALELGVVAALLWPVPDALPRLGLAGAAALLAIYAAAVGLALRAGAGGADCGCGGPAGERPLAPSLVVRNLALAAAAAAAAAWPVAVRPLAGVDALAIAGAALSLALVYAAAEQAAINASRLAFLRKGAS